MIFTKSNWPLLTPSRPTNICIRGLGDTPSVSRTNPGQILSSPIYGARNDPQKQDSILRRHDWHISQKIRSESPSVGPQRPLVIYHLDHLGEHMAPQLRSACHLVSLSERSERRLMVSARGFHTLFWNDNSRYPFQIFTKFCTLISWHGKMCCIVFQLSPPRGKYNFFPLLCTRNIDPLQMFRATYLTEWN